MPLIKSVFTQGEGFARAARLAVRTWPDALGIQKQVVLLQNRYRLIPCTDAVLSEKVYDPLGYDQLAL